MRGMVLLLNPAAWIPHKLLTPAAEYYVCELSIEEKSILP